MNLRLPLAALACAALMSGPAQAAQVFFQTFTGGLGANEQVSGAFGVKNGQVGHVNGYPNFDYSYYQLALDLTGVTDALLMFDYDIKSEYRYDGFNLLASADGQFSAADDLLTPITAGFYGPMGNSLSKIGETALSGTRKGTVLFDLSQFAGQTVDLRFQFQADYFANGAGILLDNVIVTGAPVGGAVPEPATWAMMILGFAGVGAGLRRRRALVFA